MKYDFSIKDHSGRVFFVRFSKEESHAYEMNDGSEEWVDDEWYIEVFSDEECENCVYSFIEDYDTSLSEEEVKNSILHDVKKEIDYI